MRDMAVSERNGSFAQFVAAPARQKCSWCRHTSGGSCADRTVVGRCHAIRRSRMELGERVVVIGAGPIGLLIIALAARGCGPNRGRRAGGESAAAGDPDGRGRGV